MATKSTLFSDDSDIEDNVPTATGHEIHINKNFANFYESFRKKEEFQKLRETESALKAYDSDNGNSSDESLDDELVKPTTRTLDHLASTLLALKSGGASKNFPNTKNQEELENECNNGPSMPGEKRKRRKKEKVYTMDTHRRETNWNTAEGGILSDDEKEPSFPEKRSGPGLSLQHCAVNDLLVDKGSSCTEEIRKENSFVKGLVLESSSQTIKGDDLSERLQRAFHRPNMTEDEEWLANFFMNQRHQLEDAPDSEDELRRQGSRRRQHQSKGGDMHGFVYEDEAEETRKTISETLAAFEGDCRSVEQQRPKSYPAVLESTVRIKDDKRRQRRLKDAERKAAEKQRLRQEVQQLQAVKRKEIQDRLQKIQEISGQTRLAFSEADLDDEFDPDAHDRKMQEAFGENYYDDGAESKKPVFEYDETIDADMADYDEYQVHAGDDTAEDEGQAEFCSSRDRAVPDLDEGDYPEEHDAEAQPLADGSLEGVSSRRRRGKRRRNDQLSQALQRKKPLFDPEQHDYDKYFDEYYALNFEDVIAGGEVKCRFKYKQVEPNNFGLNTEEILMADDKELNRWCGLKKIMKVDRTAEQEERDRKVYRAKGQNIAFKKKMLPTLFKPPEEEVDTETIIDTAAVQRAEEDKKKRKNLKKKLRKQRKMEEESKEEENTGNGNVGLGDVDTSSIEAITSKKAKRKRDSDDSDHGESFDDEEGEQSEPKAKKPMHTSTTVLKAKRSKADDLHKFNKKMKKKRCEEEAKLQSEGLLSKRKASQRKSRKELVVGDAHSTVLKLSDERLAAYNIAGLSKVKKQARYHEKMGDRGQHSQPGKDKWAGKGTEAWNNARKGSNSFGKQGDGKTKIKLKDKNKKHL